MGAIADSSEQVWGATGSNITSALGPANRAERRQIKRDITALEKNELGYSDAQKRQIQATALANIANQNEALKTTLAEQRASNQITAAQYTDAIGKMGTQNASQAGAVGMQAQEQSDAMAASRRQEILARIQAQAAKGRKQGEDSGKAFGKASGVMTEQYLGGGMTGGGASATSVTSAGGFKA